jgi:predicted hotdog family 3-hydroxylacyl-ACP dehydratase
MSTLTLSNLTLEDLLPHRDGMLFVKKVLEVNREHARTLFRVEKSWPMADDQGVHPLILVELAAQTAGVCNGWERVQTKGRDSNQMGWLVAIKKAEFFIDSLPFGSTVTGRTATTHSFENLREVSCELYMNDRLIGTATLQLFQASEQ